MGSGLRWPRRRGDAWKPPGSHLSGPCAWPGRQPLRSMARRSLRRRSKARVAIKGPITTPIGTGFRSVNVALRKQLDLYACIRPCRSYEGVRAPFHHVDLVLVRENTEDLYAGIEFRAGAPETHELIRHIKQFTQEALREESAISL